MSETVNESDTVAERARGLVRAQLDGGKTLAEIARLAGVAYSTLSAWMSGKYAGDNARVVEQVERWLGSLAAAAQVRSTVRRLPDFIATPSAEAFMAVFQHAQYVPDLVVITGGAGVGKTTAAREYQRGNPNVWLLTAEPSIASVYALLEYACEMLGVSENAPNRRSRALLRRVAGSNGLIILDEAQHLTSAALEQVRSLHDKAGIGIALVGNEEVYARLEGGGRRAVFAQLFSRVGMRLARARPTRGDIDAILGAAGVSGAASRKLLQTVAGKPGALRGMVKTLRVAQMLAAGEGAPALSEQHLAAAWERLSGTPMVADAA